MPFATPRRFDRRAVLCFATLAAVSAMVVGVLPASADAVPAVNSSSTTAAVGQAQQKLDALSVDADRAVEAYDQAQVALSSVAAGASAAKSAAAKQQSLVDDAKVGLQALAVARYEGGGASPALAVFLAKDPQSFLNQSQLLQQVSRYESAGLTKVVDANRALTAMQASADQAVAAQQKALAQLAARKAAVDKILGQQQSLLGTLQTQAAQQQAEAAANSDAIARQRAVSRPASRSVSRPAIVAVKLPAAAPAVVPAAASGRSAAVLAFAYAQLNKPYRFGGAGAATYDCSGLTMRAYGAAGVSLAHSAAAQQHEGRRVSLSAMQPGDLVFWGSPAYHVGIYVGGGRIIDAPHTGTVIKVRSIWGSPSSAVRP